LLFSLDHFLLVTRINKAGNPTLKHIDIILEGDTITREEAYTLKTEALKDLKDRLINKANLIQARYEKVR
jgi:hypothetical protein